MPDHVVSRCYARLCAIFDRWWAAGRNPSRVVVAWQAWLDRVRRQP